jgi:hypothetical protein
VAFRPCGQRGHPHQFPFHGRRFPEGRSPIPPSHLALHSMSDSRWRFHSDCASRQSLRDFQPSRPSSAPQGQDQCRCLLPG